jgi:hypothetical protein
MFLVDCIGVEHFLTMVADVRLASRANNMVASAIFLDERDPAARAIADTHGLSQGLLILRATVCPRIQTSVPTFAAHDHSAFRAISKLSCANPCLITSRALKVGLAILQFSIPSIQSPIILGKALPCFIGEDGVDLNGQKVASALRIQAL